MNAYTWAELREGLSCSFEAVVTEAMVQRFVELSGDDSPIHVDPEAARARGLTGVVAHGLLTASFYSTLVGVHLPGRSALLHGINIDFQRPVYPGTGLRVSGEVVQLVEAYRRVEIAAAITTLEGEQVSKARIRAGVHA